MHIFPVFSLFFQNGHAYVVSTMGRGRRPAGKTLLAVAKLFYAINSYMARSVGLYVLNIYLEFLQGTVPVAAKENSPPVSTARKPTALAQVPPAFSFLLFTLK